MISLKHISSVETFNQTKFSADSTDSSYFFGNNPEQMFSGTPDVAYNDLCFCKGNNLQYTHGHLYGSTEIKEDQIPDLTNKLPLATTSEKGLMSAQDKQILTRYNVYYSWTAFGEVGFTEKFCKKFMEYVRNTFGAGIVIGAIAPDVTGMVIGYDYGDGKYAGYLFFATNNHLHYFGYTGGTFFLKDISNS